MSMPFYVAPEQVMKDRADFARKNVARGRPLVALIYADGVLMAAENPSRTLHKISEIYDRIAFAGVGKYNEFDALRRQGIQMADVQGYQYSREDVDARSLANQYAQYLGYIFTHEMKPMEVEILVAEVSIDADDVDGNQLFHIFFDGVVIDEEHFAVLGGEGEAISDRLKEAWQPNLSLADALKVATGALAGSDRTIAARDLEVATLSRTNGRRAFSRVEAVDVASMLGQSAEDAMGGGGEP